MKNKIELRDDVVYINDIPFYIYSAEIHYFRIPKQFWEKHLEKAKQANINTISSYIPWCWHEYEEGKFDFSGETHPQRDFVGFLSLCKEFGFKFIARVGPISNAELNNEGVPGWLLRKYPQICKLGKGVLNLPHVSIYSYHNEIFKEYIKRWYSKILPIIRNYQITEGGNVILVQLCNEVGMVHWLNKSLNYEEFTENLYKKFLKVKYKNIKKLNEVYNTKYSSFENLKQPKNNIPSCNNFQKYVDLMEFYSYYYSLYYRFLYDIYKKYEIQLPVIANIPQFYDFDVRGRGVYSPTTTLMFSYFTKQIKDVVFGGAYQTRRTDYDNFHDIIITSEIVKMISHKNSPTFCCELQTGIMRDKPKLYPQDVEALLKISCACGLNGINCYMFSGGENPLDIGMFGKYHDWQAPLSIDGKEKDHYFSISQFGSLIKSFGSQISSSKNQYDLTVGFYSPYYNTELLDGKFINRLELERNLLYFDGILRLLSLAGYYYEFVDIKNVSLEELKDKKFVLVYCNDFMDLETQKKLYSYLKFGGKLIIYYRLPTKDLNSKEQSFLVNKLGLCFKIKKDNLVIYNDIECFIHTDIQVFNVNKNNFVCTTKGNEGCGIRMKVYDGEILILGFGLHHIYDYQIFIIDDIMKNFGLNKSLKLQPENYEVVRILRMKEKNSGFLFLANLHEVEKKVKKIVVKDNLCIPQKIKEITLPSRRTLILPINIKINDWLSIIYSTAEIYNYEEKENKIKLFVESVGENEVKMKVYKAPKNVKVGNRKINFSYDKNRNLLFFFINNLKENRIVIEF